MTHHHAHPHRHPPLIQEAPVIDDDEEDCSWCHGCGEGDYDGAACRKCHGTGVEPMDDDYDNYEGCDD